jgi:hypothetical protein
MLPTKGFGKDLGNGHLTTDNPNYRGGPVARWISVYGEEAKADIDAIRAGAGRPAGRGRAARVADTNRNLCIFPNLVINDGSSVTVRHFYSVAPDLMHVHRLGARPVEETEAQRARRLHAFLTFYGPAALPRPMMSPRWSSRSRAMPRGARCHGPTFRAAWARARSSLRPTRPPSRVLAQ